MAKNRSTKKPAPSRAVKAAAGTKVKARLQAAKKATAKPAPKSTASLKPPRTAVAAMKASKAGSVASAGRAGKARASSVKGRSAKVEKSGVTGQAATLARADVVTTGAEAPSPAPSERPASGARSSPMPAVPSTPPVESQQLVLIGGSPFLRVVGFVQRPDGERVPGFESLVVSKLSSVELPTENGAYELRFKVRNGIGKFELKQRTPKGATKNERGFEPDSHDALQTYRFNIP